ncbi:Poly(glycerol-phosphate) alpha-glucosyltransferase [Microbacterium sp. Bi128]|nr:Poly(glycerol-phosphate) alpha-glucosyltransferase [Microbacterium sp. Bi128]
MRSERTGMHAATLSHRKRVDHSVRAIHLANTTLSAPVGLKIFGDGSQRSQLEELITDLSETENVQLMGHVTNAQTHFKDASFSLLTSTSEAFGLVIVESMAAGCIPIAYDLPYGPASIITNGVNGFLVQYGNVEELARCIAEFVDMSPLQVQEMRQAARTRADDFSDVNVVRQWVEAMNHAAEGKRTKGNDHTVEIEDSACLYSAGGGLEVRATLRLRLQQPIWQARVPAFYCRLRLRPGEAFFRVASTGFSKDASGRYAVRFPFESDVLNAMGGSTADVFLETRIGEATTVTRMPLAEVKAAPRVYATVHGNMSISFA